MAIETEDDDAGVSLDIVFPAHNEEARIGRTLSAYRRAFPETDIQFLVASDGTSDATPEIVEMHASRDERVRLIELPKLGKGGALMEAFRRSDADFVGFVDADAATPPAELRRLVRATEYADGVIASRRHPASVLPVPRPLLRRVTSAGFAWGVRRLFHLPYTDTQCGAKVLRREVVRRVLPYLSSRDFLFDVDLLLVAGHLGFRIEEVPTLWIDQDGSRVETMTDARRMAASALRLWLHHRVIPVDGETGERGPWPKRSAREVTDART